MPNQISAASATRRNYIPHRAGREKDESSRASAFCLTYSVQSFVEIMSAAASADEYRTGNINATTWPLAMRTTNGKLNPTKREKRERKRRMS